LDVLSSFKAATH